MYKIGFLVSLIVLSLCLVSSQQKVDRKVDTEPSDTKPLDTKAQAIEEDIVYRLVTEKAEYGKNEPIKIYAELEYTGEKDEIEIFIQLPRFLSQWLKLPETLKSDTVWMHHY